MAGFGDDRDPTVSVDDLASAVDPLIVDVRTPAEYEQAHIDGALLIPLDELEARVGEIPDADPVYVICHVGGRSARGAALLRRLDLPAVSVDGGMAAWEATGRPVVDGAA